MRTEFFKKNKGGLAIVVLTWLIFFAPILTGQQAYFLDDLKIIYYPLEVVYAQFQHTWQLPVWANEFGFGQPLLAWGQLGFFTPLHLLLRALYVPPLALLQISVVGYYLIGSVGMFAFLRKRRFRQDAASLGAILFAYCGFSIGHLNHVNFYTSTMLLPWLLIAIHTILKHPTVRHATTLSIVASAITLSGQPQVVLYVFLIATIMGLAMFIQKPSKRALAWTLYAGVLTCLLSSFALLPLREFLPETERAAGLPQEELFEFSYPPWHTITLVFPYFFGGHEDYWGPKGFQELAAYTGIVPLILAGVAITSWKHHRGERIAGSMLMGIGIILSLGKYSPVYTYLIEHHYITSIGVVGRFVFFFDVGIVILAAIGLHDLRGKKLRTYIGYLLPLILIAVPVWFAVQGDEQIRERFFSLWSYTNISWWLIGAGIVSIPIALHWKKPWLIPVLCALTLIWYGWDYNPRVLPSNAFTPSPFVRTLQAWRNETGLPARLYAAEHLPVTGNPQTHISTSEPISPLFSVYQPIKKEHKPFDCIIVPIQADSDEETRMTITVRSGFAGTIWHTQVVSSKDAYNDTDQEICFSSIPSNERKGLILSFTSEERTNMKVFTSMSASVDANVYFVRVQNPTSDQLTQSIKPLSVTYTPAFVRTEDLESSLLMRNIQAVAGASSARWIGALSIRPYREFVDTFFANDSDAFDGDGVHALTRNKKLLDFAGITHLAQSLNYEQTNDPMQNAGYEIVQEADTGDSRIRLYTNPSAFPKAFLVPNAEFIAANDEIRFRMRNEQYDPSSLVYLSGPTPPTIQASTPLQGISGSATITKYTQTQVDVDVLTTQETFLVVTDATTPQWHTFIDNKEVAWLKANTTFKAAQVPAGRHTVSFQYSSPAIHYSKVLTGIGLLFVVGGYTYSFFRRRTY